jgi:sec-independent protein translocase protein TatA
MCTSGIDTNESYELFSSETVSPHSTVKTEVCNPFLGSCHRGGQAFLLIFPRPNEILHELLIVEDGPMFGFGMPELIIILVIVMVVFGAGRLPEIGNALGKSIRNFKKATEGKDEIEINPKKDEEKKQS